MYTKLFLIRVFHVLPFAPEICELLGSTLDRAAGLRMRCIEHLCPVCTACY